MTVVATLAGAVLSSCTVGETETSTIPTVPPPQFEVTPDPCAAVRPQTAADLVGSDADRTPGSGGYCRWSDIDLSVDPVDPSRVGEVSGEMAVGFVVPLVDQEDRPGDYAGALQEYFDEQEDLRATSDIDGPAYWDDSEGGDAAFLHFGVANMAVRVFYSADRFDASGIPRSLRVEEERTAVLRVARELREDLL